MKKLGMVVVILTMVAVAIVPALAQEEAAAQEERCPGMPDVPCRVDPESGLYQMLYTVPCAAFYDPSTHCTVDENGLIEKPDGTKVPYTVAAEFINGQDGFYEYVDGEFVFVEAYSPAPPVVPEYISPEFCAEYRADGRCETFRAPSYY
jgi:hypothetical protein